MSSPHPALAHLDASVEAIERARTALLAATAPSEYHDPPAIPSLPAPPQRIALPRETSADMTRIYGAPSSSPSYLAWFSFPHPASRLYSRTGDLLRNHVGDARLDHRTHRLLAERLTNALAEIYQALGREQFEREGWHVYGGSHNYRPTTSGGRLSTHAWAAAVDFNPAENPFASTRTTFSDRAMDIMERWGFLSGGRAWGKDWMHFQAAIPGVSAGSHYQRHGLPKNIAQA